MTESHSLTGYGPSHNLKRYYRLVFDGNEIVREPVIGLIKWLRPKGLKVFSHVEKCAEFKNKTLKKSAGTQKCYAQRNTPGCAISQNGAKMGVPLQVYSLNHVISVVKCNFWQQTIYNDQCSTKNGIRQANKAF